MNISEAKDQVKVTIEAYLAKDEDGLYRLAPAIQRPIFLLGAPGIGKTAIMSQVADELDIGLVSYSMTHHTRQSALGLPFIVHKEYRNGEQFDVSEYTMSEIIASIYDYMERTGHERGILFLDEINCVSETLYPSMLQFLQFKTFGRHRIPDGWVVACAGNPPEYNRSVHEFDIVTMDRMRKVEVEPSFEAWREHARVTHVHPSIMTYLEIRPEDFYLVESTPDGKSFVSARSWSELSGLISLLESLDKPVDNKAMGQYLQHEEIAVRFASYYELFNKYRSDYQIDTVLDGTASEQIANRASEAQFDERLAFLSLVLDALEGHMSAALSERATLAQVRDIMKDVKEKLLGGATVDETLGQSIAQIERETEGQAPRSTRRQRAYRVKLHVLSALRELAASAQRANATAGEAAFAAIEPRYKELVANMQELVEAAEECLDNSFAFIEKVFGEGREMLVFATELTARADSSRFIAQFGSESYHAHSEALALDTQRDAIFEEIDAFTASAESK